MQVGKKTGVQEEQLSSESNRVSEGMDSVRLRDVSQQRADGHINHHTLRCLLLLLL